MDVRVEQLNLNIMHRIVHGGAMEMRFTKPFIVFPPVTCMVPQIILEAFASTHITMKQVIQPHELWINSFSQILEKALLASLVLLWETTTKVTQIQVR